MNKRNCMTWINDFLPNNFNIILCVQHILYINIIIFFVTQSVKSFKLLLTPSAQLLIQ